MFHYDRFLYAENNFFICMDEFHFGILMLVEINFSA